MRKPSVCTLRRLHNNGENLSEICQQSCDFRRTRYIAAITIYPIMMICPNPLIFLPCYITIRQQFSFFCALTIQTSISCSKLSTRFCLVHNKAIYILYFLRRRRRREGKHFWMKNGSEIEWRGARNVKKTIFVKFIDIFGVKPPQYRAIILK